MYESARAPLKPRDIRRRAYSLMRQCWLTMLIAAVLMSLFDWAGAAVEAHGDRLGMNAYHARMETFYAENEPPTDAAAAALDAMLAGQGSPEWTDDVEYASLYDTRKWLAQYDASEQYNAAFRPWDWLAGGIDLIGTMFSCIIAIGLCHGLLNALRSGESTPHCLVLGWPRLGTACWLSIQTTLRLLAWGLLPLLVSLSLAYVFGDWGEFLGRCLILAVSVWVNLYYALAVVHLADDPDGCRTARECLRLAVDDSDAFGIWQMCKVLWPMALPFAFHVTVSTAAAFVPVLVIPVLVLQVLCSLLILAVKYACFVCIYDEIRQRIRAAEEALPANEGLARARALAADTERKITHV